MYRTAPYRAAVLLTFCSMAPLWAQSLSESPRSSDIKPLDVNDLEGRDAKRFEGFSRPGSYEVPATKASGTIADGHGVFVSQDVATLGNARGQRRDVDSVVDLSALRDRSDLVKVPVSAGDAAAGLPGELALISATYRAPGEAAATKDDCPTVALSVEQRIKLDPAKVLETVQTEISSNSSCACEVVKAAIRASHADVGLTADIVETAITTAPETMRIVSQCAIAQVPEALSTIQALLAKLDPNSGEGSSSKDAKSGKEVISAKSAKEIRPPLVDNGNPLDLPPLGPPLLPPPVYPPPVTSVEDNCVEKKYCDEKKDCEVKKFPYDT